MKTLILFTLIVFSQLIYGQSQPKVSFIFLQDQTEGEIENVNVDMKLDWNNLSQSKIIGIADVSSLNTGNKMRDKHLKSNDYFDVAQYPKMRFECLSFEKKGDKYRAIGKLMIKSITNEVEFLVEVIDGSLIWWATIDTEDFDIRVKKGEGKNKVKVRVEVPLSK